MIVKTFDVAWRAREIGQKQQQCRSHLKLCKDTVKICLHIFHCVLGPESLTEGCSRTVQELSQQHDRCQSPHCSKCLTLIQRLKKGDSLLLCCWLPGIRGCVLLVEGPLTGALQSPECVRDREIIYWFKFCSLCGNKHAEGLGPQHTELLPCRSTE